MSILTTTYPPGFENPVVLRASAALAAAGAWDAAPTEYPCAFVDSLTLNFTYTRGAAGGAFDWQIETSLYAVVGNVPAGASEWVTQSIYDAGGVAAGADTTSLVQREWQRYASQGAVAEDFSYGPIVVVGTIERIRVRAREAGVIGTPGALQIAAVMV